LSKNGYLKESSMEEEIDYQVNLESHLHYTLVKLVNYVNLDLYNVRELDVVIKDMISNGKTDIILDLSPIKFIDSSGLGVLASSGIALSKLGKKLILLNIRDSVSHLFKVSGFNKLFHLVEDINSLS
jgi:anti-sigma B factor antagonist